MDIAGPFHLIIGAYPDTDAEVITPLISGRIVGVGIAVHTNTANFTIKTSGADGTPQQTILDEDGINADVWRYPKPQIHTTAGAAVASQYDAGVPVHDTISILVEGAGAAEEFDVTFMVE